jgi:tetratricopeptide (TPR) repeat protein
VRTNFEDAALTIDFMEQGELVGQRSTPVDEQTILAMYLNNRSAEALATGQLGEAYGWARLALLRDPGFLTAANTLGVIYSRAGHGAEAEAVLRHVLAHEPDNTSALSNLVGLLGRSGRSAEAQSLSERLLALQPLPPFHDFDLGRQAMAEGNAKKALEQFKRELRRQPYQEEVHFWAAQAYWQLGEPEAAARHLRQAMESSASQAGRDRYAAKLAHLRDGTQR